MKRNSISFKTKLMRTILYASIFLASTSFAQNEKDQQRPGTQCDVNLSAADYATYKNAVANEKKEGLQPVASIIYVPVRLHIVRMSNGTGGITEAQAEQELASANIKFAPANIQFYQCKSVEYIDDNSIFNTAFDPSDTLFCGSNGPQYQLTNAHNQPNVCNIYWVNVTGNWNWGAFPWYATSVCADKVMMNINGIGTPWLLAHELGHYFGLLHTFAKANGTAENVTRNTSNSCYNATTAGDLLDDTPADPNSWNGCSYPGGFMDACGFYYSPDPQNEMGYANGCQSYFTTEQNVRMNSMYAQYRTYLSCGYLSSCNATWNISSVQTSDFAYQASNQINSSANINASVTSVYDAGNRIILTHGFNTGTNARFKAVIQPCYSTHIFNKNSFEVSQTEVKDNFLNLTAMPNPFSESTTLQFTLDETKHIRIYLTDLSGRKIGRDIVNETKPDGTFEATLDGTNLDNGIYLCVLEENNKAHILKVVVSH